MKKILLILFLLILSVSDSVFADYTDTFSDETIKSSIGSTEEQLNKTIILALECDNVIINGDVTYIFERPFLFKEMTYVPFDIVASSLGADIYCDTEENLVFAEAGWRKYAVSLQSEDIHIFDDMLFVPLRQMCEDLGFYIFWSDGLIAISNTMPSYSDEEAAAYKLSLGFSGYSDKYYVPGCIVNPYVKYTYEQMCLDINYLSKAYPDLISSFSIGRSAEGRDIAAFTLGKGDKKIIMCASMHAREYIATNFIMYMADLYAYSYVTGGVSDGYDIKELLDKVTIIIIPMVNPDGINLAQNGYDSTLNPEYLSSLRTNDYGYKGWKANTNGVDLNNNFDFLWYSRGGSPSFAGYSGPYGGSEPETIAMQNYITENDFEIFASLHTQGEVIYWMDPNCDQSLAVRFKPFIDRICRETGFTEMPSDGYVGYSGYMTDYIRYYKQKPAMTIELCPYIGDYPYPESDFDRIAYPVRNIGLILADIAQYWE